MHTFIGHTCFLKGKREKFIELIFQKEEKLHAVLSHDHSLRKVSFNMHIYPKPEIYISLGKKKKKKIKMLGGEESITLKSLNSIWDNSFHQCLINI